MEIVIEKEKLDAMYSSICEKTEKLSNLIDRYIPNDELKNYMNGLLHDIYFYVNEAYNQELVELKLQLGRLQRILQSGNDNGVDVKDNLYCEYVRIKQKISEIENPF